MAHLLIISLLISLLINLVMFLIAFKYQSDKVTDISYAVSFFVIDLYAVLHYGTINAMSFLMFAVVVLWAVRIGGFLLYRVLHVGKDKRFDDRRSSLKKFGTFWLGQALAAWILMIPVIIAINHPRGINFLFILGILGFIKGFIIESTADFQKFNFRTLKNKNHPWIDSGIWKYSRHPNYYGEIAIWISLYIAAFSSLHGAQRIYSLISPLFITILLVFISGIPILEKSADDKWGKQKDYQEYKKRTSILIPLPNRRVS